MKGEKAIECLSRQKKIGRERHSDRANINNETREQYTGAITVSELGSCACVGSGMIVCACRRRILIAIRPHKHTQKNTHTYTE